ncbi:MAG: hypothetical protein ACXQTE_03740, partial [Methanosarcinaceae archaeon]
SELVNLLYGIRAKKWIEQEIERVRNKINGNGEQISIYELEKDTAWRKEMINELASEFLLSMLKKVA